MTSIAWNELITNLPGATFLQTEEWSRIKAPVGWKPDYLMWPVGDSNPVSAAMLLTRGAGRLPVSVAYVPRGPLVDWTRPEQYRPVLDSLIAEARRKNALLIKIDPDLTIGRGIPGTTSEQPDLIGLAVQVYLKKTGWRFSQDQIQFRNTVEIDLRAPEEALLARMHQKTRYNIRLAEKKGVSVTEALEADWESIYRLYAETAARDGFIIRSWEYYRQVWSTFTQNRMATCLKAEVDGTLISAIWVISFGKKAHYLYGMSSILHREFMPNHLLQWRGMLLAKAQGRDVYDMWGAPDEFTEEDRLSGVFRFKQGFGGEVVRTLGAWDFPINPIGYRIYTSVLPRILDVMRKRSRVKTRQMLEN
jgi:lipid II:glycine glycyltransferase (peptidoglycan interpeptide bridge formation enzyme)